MSASDTDCQAVEVTLVGQVSGWEAMTRRYSSRHEEMRANRRLERREETEPKLSQSEHGSVGMTGWDNKPVVTVLGVEEGFPRSETSLYD